MIKARAMTEQECIDANLPPKGIFPFVVDTAQEKNSAKAGQFFSLKLSVKVSDTSYRVLWDSLFFTESMMFKTRHFYRSIGMLDVYEKEEFDASILNFCQGYCKIDHKLDKQTNEMRAYIRDYITPEDNVTPIKENKKEDQILDDDIPIDL